MAWWELILDSVGPSSGAVLGGWVYDLAITRLYDGSREKKLAEFIRRNAARLGDLDAT
jgi:hypothetical protein